jgi:hypothetical protein
VPISSARADFAIIDFPRVGARSNGRDIWPEVYQ